MRKGGRFTVGGAAVAHLWHGVDARERSGAEGFTAPYAASTPQPPSIRKDSNPRATVCRTDALPLSY